MTNDHDLDEIFGPSAFIGTDLLPQQLDATAEQSFGKRVTLMRGHYIRQMRCWRAQGESVDEYVNSCDESIRDEVRKIAEEEGFL